MLKVRVVCIPHPPSPQMVMVMRSCSSMAAVSVYVQATVRLHWIYSLSRSRDISVGTRRSRAFGAAGRRLRVQLAQLGVARCPASQTNKRKKEMDGNGARQQQSERTTRVVPGIRRQKVRNAKGVSSRPSVPGDDQFEWASRPSCTLARDGRHDFRECWKLGCPTVCRNLAG